MKKKPSINKTAFIIAAIFLTSLSAFALQSEGVDKVYNTVEECRAIERDSTRVACYDTIVDGSVFTIAAKKKAEREAFGRFDIKNEKGAPSEEPEAVIVEIVSVKRLASGRRQFTTKDGQIWRQLSSGHMAPERTPFKAELKKGSLGSYSIVSLKWPKLIKVKRIK